MQAAVNPKTLARSKVSVVGGSTTDSKSPLIMETNNKVEMARTLSIEEEWMETAKVMISFGQYPLSKLLAGENT